MPTFSDPFLITFSRLGKSEIGYISVVDNRADVLPFQIERVFWTYYTPESIVRGRHAHHRTEQVLVAVSGWILVTTELPDGTIETFRLDSPDKGLYVPPHAWHTMQYSHSAVQLVFASAPYDEADYIREYDDFRLHWGTKGTV